MPAGRRQAGVKSPFFVIIPTMVKLYNTLSGKKENFEPQKKTVSLYTCGPTVYGRAHIGNLRTYIFEDILRRTLEYNGYKIRHVMNITDVGHLTGDRDMGEDKLEKEGREKKKSVWDLAKLYTTAFTDDIKRLNILAPHKMPKATDYIKEQIKFVELLEKKGYTYKTSDGVYFDTSKIKDYGKLANLDIKGLEEGARVEKNPEKRNPTDFALWKFAKEGEERQMEWDSPWGKHSFPGWHVECSVLSTKFLGQPMDIHTGGVDHIPVHHTNEIAQSEAAYEKPLANYWLHGEFLILDEARMGKSEGNIITLDSLIEKGYSPLVYRYFVLSAHYRSKLNFTWDALDGAGNSLNNLYHDFALLGFLGNGDGKKGDTEKYEKAFTDSINDDLNVPQALSAVYGLIADESIGAKSKRITLLKFDNVLGLNLKNADKLAKLPMRVKNMAKEREKLRGNQQFTKADTLRGEIERLGYKVEDTPKGPFLWPLKI